MDQQYSEVGAAEVEGEEFALFWKIEIHITYCQLSDLAIFPGISSVESPIWRRDPLVTSDAIRENLFGM